MGEILNHYTSYMSVLHKKYKKGFTISNKTIKKAYPILFCLILFLSMDIIMADTLGIGEIIDEFWNAGLSFFCELMADAINFISQNLLFAFPQDMTDFYQYIGGTDGSTIVGKARTIVIVDVIKVIAFIFTNAIFIFHLIVCATGTFTEQKNTPLNLLARYAITTFAQIFSMDIADYFIEKTSELITNTTSYFMIKIITANPLSEVETFDDYVLGIGSVLADQYTEAQSLLLNTMTGIGWLIWLLLAIAILINIVKLTLEIYERYVSVVFLNIGMPLGLCFMTSRTTANITVSYFRMFFSQLFLMLFSYISVFIALLLMPNCFFTSKILSMVFLLAYLRMAQKIDSLMGNLGLNVVHTSGNLFDDVAMAGRSMGNMLKGLERGGRNLGNAKNNILDGMQKRAIMANDLQGSMKYGAMKGQTPMESIRAFENGGGIAMGGFNNATNDMLLNSWRSGNAQRNLSDTAGNELLKYALGMDSGKNPIPNMLPNSNFSNVRFNGNGTATADFIDNKGHKKQLSITSSPNLDNRRKGFEINGNGNGFGDALYAQVRDYNEPRKEMNLNDIRSRGENVSDAIASEYGVNIDSRMANIASKVKQNDLGNLDYYDDDDNYIGFQTTEDTDRSLYNGQLKTGETVFAENYSGNEKDDSEPNTSYANERETLDESTKSKTDSNTAKKDSPMALSKEDLLNDGMKGTFDGQISSIAKQESGASIVHCTDEQTGVQSIKGMIDVTNNINVKDRESLQRYFGDNYTVVGNASMGKTEKGTAHWIVPLKEKRKDDSFHKKEKEDKQQSRK